MDHILIVEDDRALSQGIRLALDQAGRQFTQCHTLREAEEGPGRPIRPSWSFWT